MTPARANNISVVDPLGPAAAWTKRMLFQPFDLAKWFTIGFCAWLAHLAEGGGGLNFHVPSGGHRNRGMGSEIEAARDFVVGNLHWIIPVVIAVVGFSLAVALVLTWLSSRGRFMFLDCVVQDKAVVAEPWRMYAREGNSLFVFRVILGLVGLLVLLLPIGSIVAGILGLAAHRHGGVPGGWIALLVVGILATFFVAIILTIIGKVTKDFVVPLMYLRRYGWTQGWSECWGLMLANAGPFMLYLLFQVVLQLAIVIVVLAAVVVTCCIAGCLLALPYLGTVLMLPVLVFLRSYSVIFLGQLGPDFDVFSRSRVPGSAPPAAV